MKLYELNRGQRFKVVSDCKVPPAASEIENYEVITFGHVDGMYSYCKDHVGNVVHPVAWAEVELVP